MNVAVVWKRIAALVMDGGRDGDALVAPACAGFSPTRR